MSLLCQGTQDMTYKHEECIYILLVIGDSALIVVMNKVIHPCPPSPLWLDSNTLDRVIRYEYW